MTPLKGSTGLIKLTIHISSTHLVTSCHGPGQVQVECHDDEYQEPKNKGDRESSRRDRRHTFEGDVCPLLGGGGGAAIVVGGAGDCERSRGVADSPREWVRAGSKLDGIGVVAER